MLDGLKRMMGVAPPLQQRSAGQPAPRNFDDTMRAIDQGWASAGTAIPGVSVMEAMQVVTVMACVRAIAKGCATPDLLLFREDAKTGRNVLAKDRPEFRVLNRRPNVWQTSYDFRLQMTAMAVLTEGALAIPVRVSGIVRELIPVRSGFFRLEETDRYEMVVHVWDQFGPIGTFALEDVFYLPNLMWDRIKGLHPVKIAASAIGLSMQAEATQHALFRNGGRPTGVLSVKTALSPGALERLREAWRSYTTSNRNGTAILDSDASYVPMAFSSVDQQHIETRRLAVEEICRAFDVFPTIIGHADKTATFASAEAFFAAHLKLTLRPWHQAWVQRLDEFVLDGTGPLFVNFDTRYLREGPQKDQAVYLRTMIEMGVMTRNEARDQLGLDPLPGLDEPLTPLNMDRGGAGDDGTPDDGGDDDQDKGATP